MSELLLSHTISHIAAHAEEPSAAVDTIARELLAFPGIRGVRIQPKGSLFDLVRGPLVWGELPVESNQPPISARAAIQIAERVWGDLHVYFDLESLAADSPVRLVQFAAEQIARIVAGEHLKREQGELARQVEYFRDQLALRKSFQRARGLLAEQHGLTDLAAGELLRRRAAQSGRPLQEVALAVIGGYERRRAHPGLARKTA